MAQLTRRGFLAGAAAIVGAGVTLLTPQGVAEAAPVLWTPEDWPPPHLEPIGSIGYAEELSAPWVEPPTIRVTVTDELSGETIATYRAPRVGGGSEYHSRQPWILPGDPASAIGFTISTTCHELPYAVRGGTWASGMTSLAKVEIR